MTFPLTDELHGHALVDGREFPAVALVSAVTDTLFEQEWGVRVCVRGLGAVLLAMDVDMVSLPLRLQVRGELVQGTLQVTEACAPLFIGVLHVPLGTLRNPPAQNVMNA